MTHDIIKLMYERDHVHAKATQSNDSKLWQDYRNLRNKVTCIIKECKNAYFNYIHTLCRNDPPKIWSEIKRLVPGKNKHSHITCDISASDFNHHFDNIGNKMNSKFQNFDDNFFWKCPKSSPSFRFNNTCMSNEDIEMCLGSLPNKSNNDILGMDLVLLRKSAPYISRSLANVINKSLKSGVFEQDWKNARVMPIYKDDGDIHDQNNYRPIPVIGHIAKMIESLVSYKIFDFLEEHYFLCILMFKCIHSLALQFTVPFICTSILYPILILLFYQFCLQLDRYNHIQNLFQPYHDIDAFMCDLYLWMHIYVFLIFMYFTL